VRFWRLGFRVTGSDSTVAKDAVEDPISRRQIPRKPGLAVVSAFSGVTARVGVPRPPSKVRERERTSVPEGSPLSPQSRPARSLRAWVDGAAGQEVVEGRRKQTAAGREGVCQ
jgi:hypothetical protein